MSGYEEAQRARKVRNMVVLVWSGIAAEDRRNHQLPWKTGQQDSEWWSALAYQAGRHRPPSAATQRQVLESLAQLVNAERRGLPEPCPDCREGVAYGPPACSCQPTPEGCVHPAAEEVCEACGGDGLMLCEGCGLRLALVATPAGFVCVPCSRRDFPGLADAVARTMELRPDPFEGLVEDEPQRRVV